MNKFSFAYLVFFYFLTAIYSLFGEISIENQIFGSLFLILLFGIPHGAIDNILLLSQSRISSTRFYLYYFFVIIIYLIIWFFAPIFSFIFFLIISSYHFGESQLANLSISSIFTKVIYLLWGISLMSTLFFYNENELIKLFDSFEDTSQFNKLFKFNVIQIIFFISNISLIIFLFYFLLTNRLNTSVLMSEIFQIVLIHITFILFPIIISFTLYFIFLHSIKVLVQEFKYLDELTEDLSLFIFIRMLAPHTFISLVFIAIFLYMSSSQIISVSILLFSIVSLSVITLPHSIVMNRFYAKVK